MAGPGGQSETPAGPILALECDRLIECLQALREHLSLQAHMLTPHPDAARVLRVIHDASSTVNARWVSEQRYDPLICWMDAPRPVQALWLEPSEALEQLVFDLKAEALLRERAAAHSRRTALQRLPASSAGPAPSGGLTT